MKKLLSLFLLSCLLGPVSAEDGSRLWLPVMRPAEGAEVEVIYKGKVSPTIAVAIAELKNAWKGEPVLLEKKRTGQEIGRAHV